MITDKITQIDEDLGNIADAIRQKGSTTTKLNISDMADAIINLPSGGAEDLDAELTTQENLISDINDIVDNHKLSEKVKIYTCASLFANAQETEINLSLLDTSKCTNFSYMFNGCKNLEKVNLEALNTSSATGSLVSCFSQCHKLKKIDMQVFKDRPMTTFTQTFYDCRELEELDLSGFTLALYGIQGAFQGCYKLTQIKGVEDLNPLNSSYCASIFKDCRSLTELDLSNWDTSKITSITDICNRMH